MLISSGQPALNPRLVKEADALTNAGYEVTVLYAYWNDWGTRFDRELIPTKKWKAVCIGGDPENRKTTYFVSRIIHKTAKLINQLTGGKYQAELAIARPSYFLMNAAKNQYADLYIGHNLGALPATVKAAKANKKPCGFDAEDFHRYEVSDDKTNPDVILKTKLENHYLPQTDYLAVSSAEIADAYKQLFPGKEPVVIRNVFPTEPGIQPHVINQDDPLKLFWFSQTIGANRGLQDIVTALETLHGHSFELHLLGHYTESIQAEISNNSDLKIYFHSPVLPTDLAKFASQFDIGLALEPGFSINNNFALSNKIFTYLQAGLCIIASNTIAQSSFLAAYPGIGNVYTRGDTDALNNILLYYHRHRDKLLEAQKAALSLAREKLNWETEQKKFLAAVENTLNNC